VNPLLEMLADRQRAALPARSIAPERVGETLSVVALSQRRGGLSDTERVVALPTEYGADYTTALARVDALHKPGGAYRLRPIQAHALAALAVCRGLLGAIGVGHGKTLIAILGAAIVGAARPVVMVPPNLRQTFFAEYSKYAASFYLPKIDLIPYSQLSRPEGTDLLRRKAPDYIFADEAHSLRHASAARTRRLLRYLEEAPGTIVCAASGTLTAHSIQDYAHLAKHALGQGSPLPLGRGHLDSWANVLDVDGRPGPDDWATFAPVVAAFGDGARLDTAKGASRVDLARRAYQRRLRATPGVIVTDDASAACSLVIQQLHKPVPPPVIVDGLRAVAEGETPNHEEVFEDDASAARAARQVSAGFFYRWAWELTPAGARDDDWLLARSTWSRYVRRVLETRAVEYFDSPALVARAVADELAADPTLATSSGIHGAWVNWSRVSDRPVPPTVPVWLSTYLVDAAAETARASKEPLLVWYESSAVGEALAARGLPLYGAGNPPGATVHTCAVSIRAHHKGLNLQPWRLSLVLEPPASGQVWEQLIGRTHRAGQEADEVDVSVFVGTEPFARAWRTAKEHALYQAATTGGVYKLAFAPVIG
jgi:hypothetical protein